MGKRRSRAGGRTLAADRGLDIQQSCTVETIQPPDTDAATLDALDPDHRGTNGIGPVRGPQREHTADQSGFLLDGNVAESEMRGAVTSGLFFCLTHNQDPLVKSLL